MTGLAVGLRVGLAATRAPCVTRTLNFCKVGIIFIHTQNSQSLYESVNSSVWSCLCVELGVALLVRGRKL